MTVERVESTPGCLGCGKPVGEYHERECEYAPYYATRQGYPPRLVNEMQTKFLPLDTKSEYTAGTKEADQ